MNIKKFRAKRAKITKSGCVDGHSFAFGLHTISRS